MGKLSGSRYPSRLKVEDAVEIAESAVNEFKGSPPGKESFAQSLGHSTANSGAYMKKVADARSYGLLPSRGLEPTELANRVANPKDDDEYYNALFEMYQNIPILSELYSHLSGSNPPSQLWNVLVDLTDASRAEAKDAEDQLSMLYEDMLRIDEMRSGSTSSDGKKRISESTTEIESEGAADSSVESRPQQIDNSGIFLKVGSDEHKFEELTDINIEIAQKILESKKRSESISSGDSSGDSGGEPDASITDFR